MAWRYAQGVLPTGAICFLGNQAGSRTPPGLEGTHPNPPEGRDRGGKGDLLNADNLNVVLATDDYVKYISLA